MLECSAIIASMRAVGMYCALHCGVEYRTCLSMLPSGLPAVLFAQGCVMGLVMSLRAWRLHEQQGERLEELAQTVQVGSSQPRGSRKQSCPFVQPGTF